MATAYHNLSDYDFNSVPNAEEMKFGIVVSEWNANITGALLDGAVKTLKKHGANNDNRPQSAENANRGERENRPRNNNNRNRGQNCADGCQDSNRASIRS